MFRSFGCSPLDYVRSLTLWKMIGMYCCSLMMCVLACCTGIAYFVVSITLFVSFSGSRLVCSL